MFKLLWANLKMMVRGRQALFWSLFFPLMFTIIFGFFFGGKNTSVGTVALINQSNTEIAKNLDNAVHDAGLFKVKDETDINAAKDELKKGSVTGVIEIPENFGEVKNNVIRNPQTGAAISGKPTPVGPKQVIFLSDPSNAQANAVISGFLNSVLTSVNFKLQGAVPIYSVNLESTADKSLTYFDFVLVGMIGLSLMNSSIQGLAIPIARYREAKILKRITTTPLATWKFIAAEVISRLVLNLAQIALVLFVGMTFFDAHIAGSLLLLLLFAILGGLLFQVIGFVVAAVAKTTDAAQGMSVAITLPMMFLAGVFFPIDQLPKWLYSIVQFLPLAPLLKMLRQIGLENISPFTNPLNIIIVGGWIVAMLAIAIWRFRLSEE